MTARIDAEFDVWYKKEGWNYASGHEDDAREIFKAGWLAAYESSLRFGEYATTFPPGTDVLGDPGLPKPFGGDDS